MAFCSCGMCFFLGGGVCHPCNFLEDSKPLTCHQNSPADGHSLEPLPNGKKKKKIAQMRERATMTPCSEKVEKVLP